MKMNVYCPTLQKERFLAIARKILVSIHEDVNAKNCDGYPLAVAADLENRAELMRTAALALRAYDERRSKGL